MFGKPNSLKLLSDGSNLVDIPWIGQGKAPYNKSKYRRVILNKSVQLVRHSKIV